MCIPYSKFVHFFQSSPQFILASSMHCITGKILGIVLLRSINSSFNRFHYMRYRMDPQQQVSERAAGIGAQAISFAAILAASASGNCL